MHKYFLAFIGVVIVALAGAGVFQLIKPEGPSATSPLAEETGIPENEIPDLTLESFSGEEINIRNLKGTPLVLNAWAVWCPFCVDELPDFVTAQSEFGDAVIIVAIDRAEAKNTAIKFTDELGITNDLLFLLDPRDSFYRKIGGFSMPETLFIDKDGVIQDHVRGPMSLSQIRENIENIIK